MAGYSRYADPEESSRAIGRELPISFKQAIEICRFVRGKRLDVAKRMLNEVMDMKRPVPYRKFRGSVGHRKGSVGPGRYPVKAARAILRTLENAEANAEMNLKVASDEDLYVWHIASSKGMTQEAFFARAHGRTSPKRRETVNVEVILKMAESDE